MRDEATINEPKDFRVWRAPEHNPAGEKHWRDCGATQRIYIGEPK